MGGSAGELQNETTSPTALGDPNFEAVQRVAVQAKATLDSKTAFTVQPRNDQGITVIIHERHRELQGPE